MTPNPTISLAPNGDLLLHLARPSGPTHSIRVPLTTAGLSLIRRTLEARLAGPPPRIGTPSSPTQAQIDDWLARKVEPLPFTLNLESILPNERR